jgi:membrane transport protein XK
MRYFANRLADYLADGHAVQVDLSRCSQYILRAVDAIRSRMPPTADNCDGGLYLGCAGVAFSLYRLAVTDPLSASRDKLLSTAVEYTDVALAYATTRRTRDPVSSFLLGPGGVFAVGSLVYDAVGRPGDAAELRKKYSALAAGVAKPGDFLGCGSDELFVGRAGYLCGALMLNSAYKQQV